jgi:5-methyltetrahydropteroyltriglutamate--homocysteine methyltransferase
LGAERVWVAPSCSLLHSPCDLDFEQKMNPEIKQWLAFAKQKIDEVVTLKQLANAEENKTALEKLKANQLAVESRKVFAWQRLTIA